MLQHTKISAVRRSLWNRMRLQLGVGLLLSVFAPFAARYLAELESETIAGLYNSLLGTFLAVTIGYYTFKRFSNYPGVRSAFHIFPAFATSYAFALTTFFLFRLNYSRLQFIVSFVICLIWYYTVHFQLGRQKRLSFGIVPFGSVDRLREISSVDWVPLVDHAHHPARLDGIVADLRAELPDEWERFLSDRALEGMLVMHVKQLEESLTGRVELEHLSENNFGSLIPGVVYAKVKRAIDFVGALIALPLVTAVLALAAIAIKLDSPGPVFFLQRRAGFRGHPFTIVKLRTMRAGEGCHTDEREAAMTRDGDVRVTRLGRFLRRSRIDELPQILNILRGEMSWIGPRPEALALSQWYETELPFYRYRHIVRPGITGWAQVKLGHVAEVDEVMEKLHYDFYYIRNFSIWLDVLIVAATVRTVVRGFGAR